MDYEQVLKIGDRVHRELFPRNFDQLLSMAIVVWKQHPSARNVAKPATLLHTLSRLKTSRAISVWVQEGAPLPQIALLRASLSELQIRLRIWGPDDPRSVRACLRVDNGRYWYRDVLIAGLLILCPSLESVGREPPPAGDAMPREA